MRRLVLSLLAIVGLGSMAIAVPTIEGDSLASGGGYSGGVFSSDEEFSGGEMAIPNYVRPVRFAVLNRSSWAGLSIGYSDLGSTSTVSYLGQRGNSLTVNINPVELVLYSRGRFVLSTGLGVELNNFSFSDNMKLAIGADGVLIPDLSYAAAGIVLKKSKLSTNYVTVPLLVEFNPSRYRRDIHISGGVVAGALFNSHTKVKYESAGVLEKSKGHDLPIEKLRLGYTLQFGWRSYGIFVRYYPTSIFETNKGPDVGQLTVGLHFGGF